MPNVRLLSSRPAMVARRPLSSVAATATSTATTTPPQPKAGPKKRHPIYVSATKQHVGKTTTSLALMSGLQKRFERVGFMKPVGQQHLKVTEEGGKEICVDKDVVVVRQHFGLEHCTYQDMSPVLIPPGYTRDYIDGRISDEGQQADVLDAFQRIDQASNVVLCEGTGHVAVGSIVGASNARVASWMDAKMVLVANGGLGSTFDDLELNRVLCAHHNVEVAGVVVNKVQNDKYEQTRHYIEKALHQYWGIPLLGCIPDRPFLGCPALADLERLLAGSYLVAAHQDQRLKHYRVQDINLVSTSLDCFLRNIRRNQDRTLYLCHSSRVDIMLGFFMEYHRLKRQHSSHPWEAALVVCGTAEYDIPQNVLDIIHSMDAPPMLVCQEGTRKVMERILAYTPKHNNQDTHRLEIAVHHYEPYIDFDLMLQQTGHLERSTSDSADVGDVASTASA